MLRCRRGDLGTGTGQGVPYGWSRYQGSGCADAGRRGLSEGWGCC